MRNHWSCSKFADWLRGTKKINSGTSKEWREWDTAAKRQHPIRYWLAEDGLDKLQNVIDYIPSQLNSIRYYLNNRFLIKSHALTAHPRDIKPGQWRDVGDRFLPCLFNELVNFVEVEQAWMHVCFADDDVRQKYNLPWWREQWWSRWLVEWRCPQAGLDYLDWASRLTLNEFYTEEDPEWNTPSPQAIAAKEIKELYIWWTVTRPARKDPYDESGWSKLCDNAFKNGDFLSILDDEKTEEERETTRSSLNTLRSLEAKYENEDEEMLLRLVRIRNALWT